ncbi:MAG: bifunctional diguanylate cyclase/phosphodiesterase [Pseudomonadota bacterium]|jgi:diguanylate cyclase (GGDEF)-like protein
MLPPNYLQKIWPFSIKTYAFGFIVFLALVFGGISWLMLKKTGSAETEIQQSNMQTANAELSQAVTLTLKEGERLVQSFVNWDETRQQLAAPAYYIYWRDNRALSAGAPTSYLKAVELYDQDGKALGGRATANMPEQLSTVAGRNDVLVKQSGRDYLYLTAPIPSHEDPKQVSGFVAIKVDFLKAVQALQSFRYTDAGSISVAAAEEERLAISQIGPRLKFSLAPNPELASLLQVTINSQYQTAFVLVIASLLLYIALASLLATPLRRLSQHIDTLRDGHGGMLLDSLSTTLPVAELEKVRISLNDYQNKLEEMHTSLDQKNNELWELAHRDPLTGIHNRRCFEDDWEHVLSVAAGRRINVSFLLFDCDHFKAINDTYGHHTGDLVIQAIARALQSALRHGDRLYRLGGDEFATLFLDSDSSYAQQVAERCVEAINHHDFSHLGVKEPIRISIGLAHAPGTDIDNLAALQKQADIAMYHAKRPGRSKITVYADSMADSTSMLFSNRVTSAVIEAITSGAALEMHYQPVIKLPGKETAYYEALVRIRHENELLMPSSIFPVVEGRRLEVEFDFAVINRILEDCKEGKIPYATGVSINISGPAITHSEIVERLKLFAPYLASYKFVVEVTETALITQLQQASANLTQLRELGFMIALDDFGSGYSSLGYLASMPVDLVKFDISLIKNLHHGDRQSSIVEGLAAMIGRAGYQVVAEGIETEETLHKVCQIGFSHAQGYLLGRPEKTCQY